ncbi:MAG TPA: methyltransferase domain-containing protein, partial [Candidatus Deferrimicrobium sp.]|nr:methyltransferase domain-containing protein [Candidatus Deferrimicrobium sp.]
MEKELLNIGCGDRFHKDWENIDLVPFSADVKKIDILGRLPYRDQSFQAVYCSHMLEHLDRDAAAAFAREVFRILKKNGIFRVLVPDLEQMARLYL